MGDLRKPSTGRTAALAFVAGALNAVVLARGLTVGGREDAMTALANFWQRVAGLQSGAVLRPSWYDLITHNYRLEHSPAYFFFDLLSRVFSPYQFTPLNYNSLKSILAEVVDFEGRRYVETERLRGGHPRSCCNKAPDLEDGFSHVCVA